MELVTLLWFAVGCVGGLALGWGLFSSKHARTQQLLASTNIQLASATAYSSSLKEQLDKAHGETLQERNKCEEALHAKQNSEKQLALIQQTLDNARKEKEDWEKQRKEMMEAAKASVMETGTLLSNKLLADHKREAEEAKKEGEEQIRKVTEGMVAQVKNLADQVVNIKEQHNVIHKQFGNVTRMLATPHGAGSLSEMGLENALKACDLIEGRDFHIQYTISGGEAQGLRPDCVIFLPHNSVMVIDSKSSKLFGEFSDIDSPEKEKEIIDRLVSSMNRHLKGLASKNYEDAIRKEYASAGRSDAISNVWNVMYVPSESIIEKILSVDIAFRQRCLDDNIILAGPAGLYSLLLIASRQVELAKQSENYHQILDTVGTIVDRFATTLGHLVKFSKQYTTAANTFSGFINSVNRTLLPKLSELSAYGITSSKRKDLPLKLPSFEVRSSDEMLQIEVDAEEEQQLVN